ncbi:Phospholipid phosphatase 3 [Manis javanica]|nr:Phospholipid phosphatase 3 [Manis javanica]
MTAVNRPRPEYPGGRLLALEDYHHLQPDCDPQDSEKALPSAVIPPHPVWPQRSAWRDDPCPGPAAELTGPHEQHLRSHGLQAAGHLYVCQHGQMLLIGIAKVTGHLQPHFLAVCLPDPASFCCESGYITKHNCTGHWRRSSRPGEWTAELTSRMFWVSRNSPTS